MFYVLCIFIEIQRKNFFLYSVMVILSVAFMTSLLFVLYINCISSRFVSLVNAEYSEECNVANNIFRNSSLSTLLELVL